MSAISGVLAPTVDVAPLAAASGAFTYTWLLIALPAIGAAILLLGGKRTNAWGHWLGVLASAAAFAIGAWLFFAMLAQPSRCPHALARRPVNSSTAALSSGSAINTQLSVNRPVALTYCGPAPCTSNADDAVTDTTRPFSRTRIRPASQGLVRAARILA